MKLVIISYRFEFSDKIEFFLEKHNIGNFVRLSRVEASDADGKHYGTKVYPSHGSVVQAQVPEKQLKEFLTDLETFKHEEDSHKHLSALVLPVENQV